MIKFIIVIGRKSYSSKVGQTNYGIIQTFNRKTVGNLLKHKNGLFSENLKRKIVKIKRYAENMLIK